MSQKEFQRVKVIENAVDGRLSVSEAAGLLQLSERQVQFWFCSRTRSHLNWYFLRVTVRHKRCSASGTKLKVNS